MDPAAAREGNEQASNALVDGSDDESADESDGESAAGTLGALLRSLAKHSAVRRNVELANATVASGERVDAGALAGLAVAPHVALAGGRAYVTTVFGRLLILPQTHDGGFLLAKCGGAGSWSSPQAYASATRFCHQSLAIEPCVGERDGKALGALPLGVALDPGSNPAAPDVLVAHSSNAENGEWMRHVL